VSGLGVRLAGTPQRYGGLAALSGGLVGPPGTRFDHGGDLDGTPAYLACVDSDPHIPVERVYETREVLEPMNADVTEYVRPGGDHSVPVKPSASSRTTSGRRPAGTDRVPA
jgi:predicted esterase